MTHTIEALIEYKESLLKSIEEYEQDIKTASSDIAKAAKKNDLKKVRHLSQMITRYFESITQLREYLERNELEITDAKRRAGGWDVIVDYLNELYAKDLEWHKELREARGTDEEKNWNKTTILISRMSEKEAKDFFRRDLDARYFKLVKQIEKKVGAVIKCDLKRNENIGLDGYVEGENGSATLTTIGAGGYNIQRFHYRTTVK